MQKRKEKMNKEELEKAANKIGYKLVLLPRNCGRCKYLGEYKNHLGNKCENPEHCFRSKNAAYRQRSTPACKDFEEKEKEI